MRGRAPAGEWQCPTCRLAESQARDLDAPVRVRPPATRVRPTRGNIDVLPLVAAPLVLDPPRLPAAEPSRKRPRDGPSSVPAATAAPVHRGGRTPPAPPPAPLPASAPPPRPAAASPRPKAPDGRARTRHNVSATGAPLATGVLVNARGAALPARPSLAERPAPSGWWALALLQPFRPGPPADKWLVVGCDFFAPGCATTCSLDQ